MRVYNPASLSYTKNQANSRFITIDLNDVEPGSPEENLLQELSKKVNIIEDVIYFTYEGTYTIDGWTDASAEDKANGYNYTQTINLSSDNENAPTVTSNSKFLSTIGCPPTGVANTDNALRDALAIIANGNSTSGAGTITTIVQEKPTVDIPVIWTLKTEVQ